MPDRFALVPAAHVYLLRGRDVLLQRRRNTGYLDGYWVAGAAGHIEAGESARAAAAREVKEELGVDVALEDLVPATLLHRTDGSGDPVEQRADWYFTLEHWAGVPQVMEPAKCSGIGWYPLDSLPSPMPRYETILLAGLGARSLAPFTYFGFDRDAGREGR